MPHNLASRSTSSSTKRRTKKEKRRRQRKGTKPKSKEPISALGSERAPPESDLDLQGSCQDLRAAVLNESGRS